MFRATLKSLLGHKLRLALTVLAIMLGTGLIAGSYVFTDTLDKVFSDLFADSFAGIDAQVTGSVSDELASFTRRAWSTRSRRSMRSMLRWVRSPAS